MKAATQTMLDGIKEACEAWGRAMRWILTSNGEGYPTLATFERARGGELDAKAVGPVRQKFGEVMLGDALAVSLAIRMAPPMPEEYHRVIFMHFVVPKRDAEFRKITIAYKAEILGYSDRRGYYTDLDRGLRFLLTRVPIEHVSHEASRADSVHTM